MSSSCSSKSCGSKSSSCGAPQAGTAMQDLVIQSSLGKIKHKILVMSGKGGVGKSTVATNLALGLANKGYQVGLMDVDLHGPDVCRMLGLTESLKSETRPILLPAMRYNGNLKVMSLEYIMSNRDDAIIWRGPLKMSAIRQFISDVDWGDLDYLIIDAPPGTGDEPLTVSQLIKDGHALIVTTPQEVALADVRKSINFCHHVNMDILGLIENMSGFVCPHCNQEVEIFKSGGGERTARDFNIRFLGRIPMDPQVVVGGDDGRPYLASVTESMTGKAFGKVIAMVEEVLPAHAGTLTEEANVS